MLSAMQHCVPIGCYELLASDTDFRLALHDYLHCTNTQLQNNPNFASVQEILSLIELVFDMFREMGLWMLYNVYMSVRSKQDQKFDTAEGRNTCVFSKLPSLQCIRVDTRITVHNKYGKWLQCLWLITHIHEVEHQCAGSRSLGGVQQEHAELYRKSMLFVLQSLQDVYAHVMCANQCKRDNFLQTQNTHKKQNTEST